MTEATQIDQMRALTAFGKLGMQMAGARVLSLVALFGLIGLGGYTIYSASWHGVCLCGIVALVAISAFRGETRESPKEPQ